VTLWINSIVTNLLKRKRMRRSRIKLMNYLLYWWRRHRLRDLICFLFSRSIFNRSSSVFSLSSLVEVSDRAIVLLIIRCFSVELLHLVTFILTKLDSLCSLRNLDDTWSALEFFERDERVQLLRLLDFFLSLSRISD
jgi:hypothetical protein